MKPEDINRMLEEISKPLDEKGQWLLLCRCGIGGGASVFWCSSNQDAVELKRRCDQNGCGPSTCFGGFHHEVLFMTKSQVERIYFKGAKIL